MCFFHVHYSIAYTIVQEAVAVVSNSNPNNCCRQILIAILKLVFQILIGKDHQAKISKINLIERGFKEGMLFSSLLYYSWFIGSTYDDLHIFPVIYNCCPIHVDSRSPSFMIATMEIGKLAFLKNIRAKV